jgi:hypothetical protein
VNSESCKAPVSSSARICGALAGFSSSRMPALVIRPRSTTRDRPKRPLSGPGGKIGQGALFDPASLAKALAQQEGGRRAAIGYRFDVDGAAFTSL